VCGSLWNIVDIVMERSKTWTLGLHHNWDLPGLNLGRQPLTRPKSSIRELGYRPIQVASEWLRLSWFALFNKPKQLQQWNNLRHVQKHKFTATYGGSLPSRCSAGIARSIKWCRNNKNLCYLVSRIEIYDYSSARVQEKKYGEVTPSKESIRDLQS
jgi:hypothetical protein